MGGRPLYCLSFCLLGLLATRSVDLKESLPVVNMKKKKYVWGVGNELELDKLGRWNEK